MSNPFQAPAADHAHERVVFNFNGANLEGINQIHRAFKLFIVQFFVVILFAVAGAIIGGVIGLKHAGNPEVMNQEIQTLAVPLGYVSFALTTTISILASISLLRGPLETGAKNAFVLHLLFTVISSLVTLYNQINPIAMNNGPQLEVFVLQLAYGSISLIALICFGIGSKKTFGYLHDLTNEKRSGSIAIWSSLSVFAAGICVLVTQVLDGLGDDLTQILSAVFALLFLLSYSIAGIKYLILLFLGKKHLQILLSTKPAPGFVAG